MIAREALEGMAEQARSSERVVWFTAEHMSFMPPIGRCTGGEVVETEDGEFELHMRASELPRAASPVEADFFDRYLAEAPEHSAPDVAVRVSYPQRNFEGDVAEEIETSLGDLAATHEAYSSLPPMEWVLTLSAAWTAAQFGGGFLKELGRRSSSDLADRIAAWTKKSRRPNDSAVFNTILELPGGGTIRGCVIASPDDLERAVRDALSAVSDLASFAGYQTTHNLLPSMEEATFFLDGDRWRLGWWTDGASVYLTDWFQENEPDPDAVLGYSSPWFAIDPQASESDSPQKLDEELDQ